MNLLFPNRLRECRLNVGLSQFDVIIRLGQKSNNRLSQWEGGKRLPNVVNLFRLAEIYQVSPQELYPEIKSKNQGPT